MTAKMPMLTLRNNKRGNMATQTNLAKYEENHNWEEKKDLLKRTICKGADDSELELFIHACKRTGLDPFMKQIYAVKRWSSADKREVMTMQTSIDGFRVIAERTGRYAPGPEPKYVYNDKGELVSATAYVKKMTADGTWHEISASAFYDEYVQTTKEGKATQFWSRMPHVMLAKCSESLALRKAFPAELSGIYTFDEMAQASKMTNHQEALDVEHAIAIEAQSEAKSEEDLLEQFYDLMKDAPEREKIAHHLNFCFSKTKKSKRDFLAGCIEDPDTYLTSFKTWLANKNVN